jgi:opacity protein-like surface antigen
MQMHKSLGFMTVFVVAFAASALGQQPGQPGGSVPPVRRGYIAVLGGAASGQLGGADAAAPTAPVFSVEYGDDVRHDVLAYLTLSYIENLMPQPLRDDLEVTASALTQLTGALWEFQGRDRAVIFVAGGKYLFGRQDVQPYVGGGAGIINVRRTVLERNLGDLTAAVFNDFDGGSADLSLASAGLTRPLIEAAVGVGISKGNTYVDIGYRYRRAFRLVDTLDFGQFSVGIGYRF